MSPQPRHSSSQWDTWESGIPTVTEKEVCMPPYVLMMQLDPLWLCLIGVMLSIHHYSTLDEELLLSWMLETFAQLSKLQGKGHWKIGSGESATWLVSNCDVTAGLLPLRYIFFVTKIYVWYHSGNHNKLKMLGLYCLKKHWCPYFGWDEFAGIYKATLFSRSISYHFKHVITNHEVWVMIWKVVHMFKRDLLPFS